MSVLRSGSDIWDSDEVVNDYKRSCPIIGFLGIDNVTIQSGSTSGDFPADNLLNEFTHLRWRDDGDGRQEHVFEVFNLYFETNYVALAVHNLQGQLIQIFGATGDSPNDYVELFPETAIPSNRPMIFEFESGQYTSIRIRIDNTSVGNDDFKSIAIMQVGQLLRFSRGVKIDTDHPVVTRNLKTDSLAGFSEAGQFMGKLIRNQIRESKFEFSNIPNDDMTPEGFWLTYWLEDFAAQYPFFIAWAPDDYPEDVGFGWTTGDIEPLQNPVTRRWSFAIPFRGYAEPSF